jgi:predicted alpha/beta superfamily hydrolase
MKPVHLIFCTLLLAFPESLRAAQSLTLKLYRIPDQTPSQDQIHAAGSFNNWNPADPNAIFQKDAQGVLTLTLPLAGTVAFKITRGSWATVERDDEGRDIGNREMSVHADAVTKAIRVSSWADLPASSQGTRSGTIELVDLPLKNFGTRKIWIYLPPHYAVSDQRYPVLYMYDAQNLFDRRSTAFGQEWNVDESLEELYYEENHPGLIVVAIDNSSRRGCEYNVFPEDPHPFCADGSALGQDLNAALTQELKPWIDQRYRTRTAREHTAVMGSSMGGQMALAMGLRYPEIFSRVFALSPSYQNQLEHPLRMPDWIRSLNPTPSLTVYQDMGDAEVIRELKAQNLIMNMRAVQDALKLQGLGPEQNEALVVPGAAHNEKAWSMRFKDLARRLR